MKRLLLVLALVALALPAGGGAVRARALGLHIDGIVATFSEAQRQTTYAVVGLNESDASATCCTYAWKLELTAVDPDKPVDEGCDNHGKLTGTAPTFVWQHGNVGDPVRDDGCSHDGLGRFGHQGLITVTVGDDAGFECTATYKGTIGSDEAAAAGLEPAGEPLCYQQGDTTPPPSSTCKCALFAARILPGSLEQGALRDKETLRVAFRVHWLLNCTHGSGGCVGGLTLASQHHAANRAQHDQGWETLYTAKRGILSTHHSLSLTVRCRAKCAAVGEGAFDIVVVSNSPGLSAVNRADESIPIVIQRRCQAKTVAPLRLSIAFDGDGKPDPKRSKLH